MRLRILLGTIILVAALAIYGIAAMAVAVAPAAEAHHLLAAFDRAVADDEAERFALVVQLLKRRRPEQRFILRLRRDPRDQPIEAGDLAMQVMGRGHVLFQQANHRINAVGGEIAPRAIRAKRRGSTTLG